MSRIPRVVMGAAVLMAFVRALPATADEPTPHLYLSGSSCIGTCACSPPVTCDDALVDGLDYFVQYDLWMTGADSVASVRFGFEYTPSIDFFGFRICTGGWDVVSDEYPASGSWTEVFWFDCLDVADPTQPVNVGYFSARSTGDPGLLRLASPADTAVVEIRHCDGSVTVIEPPYAAIGFGGVPGHRPCDVVSPAQHTSWSRIKRLYAMP